MYRPCGARFARPQIRIVPSCLTTGTIGAAHSACSTSSMMPAFSKRSISSIWDWSWLAKRRLSLGVHLNLRLQQSQLVLEHFGMPVEYHLHLACWALPAACLMLPPVQSLTWEASPSPTGWGPFRPPLVAQVSPSGQGILRKQRQILETLIFSPVYVCREVAVACNGKLCPVQRRL